MHTEKPPGRFLCAIALISASALAYEILLMRLFSIVQWHHFAYMMISLALLGYGASGTFLTLARNYLAPRFTGAFVTNAALFGLSSVACFLIAQEVSFNALEILWSLVEWRRLITIYLLLIPPFFFAANCVGLSLQHFKDDLGGIYAVNLLGSGAGALGAVVVLFLAFPLTALHLIGGAGLIAAALAWLGLGGVPRRFAAVLAAGAPTIWIVFALSGTELKPVEYKGLAQTLQVIGTSRLGERSGPLGLLTVVQSPAIPFRHVPGLSLNSKGELPEQLAVFADGDGMSVINHYSGDLDTLSFLDYTPSALPYHLLPSKPYVLVLGAGGGSEVLQALYHKAALIDAVELNAQMVDLVRHDYAEFAGRIYQHPEVRVHVDDARGFVAASKERFDLIQLALLDAFNASSAGLYALNESYVYTVQALQDYLAHLAPGGMLAITRWIRLPPRDDVKLFATAVEALTRSGIGQPGHRLAWIRGWQTSTLLIKNGEFSVEEVAALRTFCAERSFDPVWHPGVQEEETNVHNVLKAPYFFQAAAALLGPDRQSFITRYKFNIEPATDDQPYFFLFFKWPLLSELLERRGAGGLSMLDMGYLTLVVTLIQAALVSILLILAPLRALGRAGDQALPKGEHRRAAIYFSAIGLAFMFTEMVHIQKFILYLAHPLYAIPVVLTGFLLFAGLGSAASVRFEPKEAARRVVQAVSVIALVSLIYLLLLPPLFDATMGFPAPVKVAIVLLLIAPIGFFMGMPFPLGLARLARSSVALIPWVWGINGCASVIAAILATLLSIHFGQTVVLLLALLLYAVAAGSQGERTNVMLRPSGSGIDNPPL